MHELLLFGQIPSSRHSQVLNIFAGIAAMQPQPIVEKHLVFKPNRKLTSPEDLPIGAAQEVNKSQFKPLQAQTQGDLFYMQLVAEVPGAGALMEKGEIEAAGSDKTKPQQWMLQYRDIPDAARQRPVTSRLIADTPITSGDPMRFMAALDYSHISSQLLTGHRFTHNSTSILLYRPLIPSAPSNNSGNIYNGKDTISLSKSRLLDPSGSYIVQAAIRVQDGSKVETMQKGVNELLALKETLRGAVELEMGDRLALDTRVR